MALKKNPLIVVCNNKVKKKKWQQINLMTRLRNQWWGIERAHNQDQSSIVDI